MVFGKRSSVIVNVRYGCGVSAENNRYAEIFDHFFLELALFCSLCIEAPAANHLDAIKSKVREHSLHIQSIQYEYDNVMTIDLGKEVLEDLDENVVSKIGKGFVQTTKVKYAQDGAKFRFDIEMVSSTGAGDEANSSNKSIVAFDGRQWQRYDESGDVLALSSDHLELVPSQSHNPIVSAYYGWLVPDNSTVMDYSNLLSQSLWDKRFQHAEYLGSEELEGLEVMLVRFPCDTMKVQKQQLETFLNVYFATDLDYFPVAHHRIEKKSGRIISKFSVTDHKIIEADGFKTLTPLVCEIVTYGKNSIKLLATVSEASIQINQPIDSDWFSLPETIASSVTHLSASNLSLGATLNKANQSGDKSWFLLIFNIVVVVFLICIICLKNYNVLPRKPQR